MSGDENAVCTSGTEQSDPDCKSCKEPIEGVVVMMHDRFPFHRDCYLRTVGAGSDRSGGRSE